MKLCAGMAATLGLSQNAVAKMAMALTSPERPPVIWIGAQECTGCTESLLRSTHPTIENLILNTISLEYHEVLSAAFGHQAEENKHNAIKRYKGKYVLVVDGSIPLKDGGVYCMVAGEPIVDHIRRAAADAGLADVSVMMQQGDVVCDPASPPGPVTSTSTMSVRYSVAIACAVDANGRQTVTLTSTGTGKELHGQNDGRSRMYIFGQMAFLVVLTV